MADPSSESVQDRHLRLGAARLAENMLNHAEMIFRRVIDAEPGQPQATRLLGVTLCKLGRGGEGISLLSTSADNDPQAAMIWSDLAVALRDDGQGDRATAAYAQAVAADPSLAWRPLAEQPFAFELVHYNVKVVDYPYRAEVRHGAGRPAHPQLDAVIGAGRDRYKAVISELAELNDYFAVIPIGGDPSSPEPFWLNPWFPPLDAMALSGMLKRHDPVRFMEIGSGVSTKYARRAVEAFGLRTRLTSVDPQPRNEVDRLCDEVLRQPLEACDPAMFEVLEPGDILFLDSSHRSFQGSDVTVFFLEILPRLKPGVIVHIHDIYLPYDYIGGHLRRLWNEQYLLATALIFGAQAFEILFPCWYVEQEADLVAHAREQLCQGALSGIEPYGASFWLRKA
jgi:hypothetical protein